MDLESLKIAKPSEDTDITEDQTCCNVFAAVSWRTQKSICLPAWVFRRAKRCGVRQEQDLPEKGDDQTNMEMCRFHKIPP